MFIEVYPKALWCEKVRIAPFVMIYQKTKHYYSKHAWMKYEMPLIGLHTGGVYMSHLYIATKGLTFIDSKLKKCELIDDVATHGHT